MKLEVSLVDKTLKLIKVGIYYYSIPDVKVVAKLYPYPYKPNLPDEVIEIASMFLKSINSMILEDKEDDRNDYMWHYRDGIISAEDDNYQIVVWIEPVYIEKK